MKTTRKSLSATIALLLLGATPLLRADQPAACPSSGGPAAAGASCTPPPRHEGAKERLHQRLHWMKERLGLTKDQVEKIKPLLHGEEKQIEAIHEATSSQIRSLLTPEQQQKLDEMKAHMGKGPGPGTEPGPGGEK